MKNRNISAVRLWLKSLSAGKSALWKRILVYGGSALAVYQSVDIMLAQESITGKFASDPVYRGYIEPIAHNVFIYLAVAAVLALIRQASYGVYTKKIKGRDIKLCVRVGDIFSSDGGVIVPSNNAFIHDARLIGTNSIQAQLAAKCESGEYTAEPPVADQIKNSSSAAVTPSGTIILDGKEYKSYEYGSVIPVNVLEGKKPRRFYFLSMSRMTDPNNPSTDEMMLAESIDRMWGNINRVTTDESLTAPVIATGAAQFCDIPSEIIARYMLKSFANFVYRNKGVKIKKFTLIIRPQDYIGDTYDIESLHSYVDYLCEFPDNETEIIKEREGA